MFERELSRSPWADRIVDEQTEDFLRIKLPVASHTKNWTVEFFSQYSEYFFSVIFSELFINVTVGDEISLDV